MGRKKIAIKRIEADSQRRATFEKRRVGLLKKAMELSILCDCELSVTIKPRISAAMQDSYYIYSSNPYDKVIENFQKYKGQYTLLTNEHINDLDPGKVSSRQVGHKINKTNNDIDNLSSNLHTNERQPTPFVSIPMMVRAENMRYIPTMRYPAMNMNVPPDIAYSPSFNELCKGLNFNLPPQVDLPKTEHIINDKKRSIKMMVSDDQEKNDEMDSIEPPKKKIKTEDNHNTSVNKVDIAKLIKTES